MHAWKEIKHFSDSIVVRGSRENHRRPEMFLLGTSLLFGARGVRSYDYGARRDSGYRLMFLATQKESTNTRKILT